MAEALKTSIKNLCAHIQILYVKSSLYIPVKSCKSLRTPWEKRLSIEIVYLSLRQFSVSQCVTPWNFNNWKYIFDVFLVLFDYLINLDELRYCELVMCDLLDVDVDHDDVLQLMQMGFSRLKFKTILQDYKSQHQDDH